ncbi:PEP-CTERM protein-sorting domain-containing protein [Rhodoferax sp. OV413]|uniref:choice-of-anchor R domain-containing protein n=1 Tax=Rhodoferax sp. OV413 TaxID=1855285 RepID=UPI00087E5F00|nr:choice-of-anchor R domain-containing protein [Rhodoferax sp. OV413]SDP82345.1 PEP-CTERM protein-sorting domain-containing protein [Rhodoferax sp. OV413]
MFSKLPTFLRTALLSASACVLLAAIPAAQAGVVYSNLDAAQSGSDAVYGNGPLANSFTTGASGGTLNAIQALLMNLGPDIVSDVQVNLLSSSSGAPGSTLAAFNSLSSAGISSAGFAAYSFSLASGYNLAANTTYWIEVIAADVNAIQWSYSSDLSGVGVAGESSYSAAFGVSPNAQAAADGFGPYQMAVELPEPGSFALVGLGLAGVLVVRRRKQS